MAGARRWLSLAVAAALLVASALRVAVFYRTHWSGVVNLPRAVAATDRRHHSIAVPLAAVSPWFLKSLVATEDRSFYTNLGVSVRGVARSFWVDMTEGRYAEGGSTLTQELVRDEILGPEKTFRRKLSEALLALAVTARYSKAQILDMYVNEVYLGQGYYGVGRAARGYFGVPARSLTIGQAALLAGLPQAPSALDPVAHLSAARRREWVVLQNLVAVRALTAGAARRAFDAPLHLRRAHA